MFGGGFEEIGFLLFIAFLLFGPEKLPEIARTLGKGLSEFRRASNELKSSLEEEIRNLDREPAATSQPGPVAELRRASHELRSSLEEGIRNLDLEPAATSQPASDHGHHDPEPAPEEPQFRP